MNPAKYQQNLETVSRHCPEALSTYFHCINRIDGVGDYYFTKYLIEVVMSENFRQFRNNIKKLARENLLQWHPFGDGISVTLALEDESDDA